MNSVFGRNVLDHLLDDMRTRLVQDCPKVGTELCQAGFMRIRIRHARIWTSTANIEVLSGQVEVRRARKTRNGIAVRASNNKLDASERDKLKKGIRWGQNHTIDQLKRRKEEDTYPTLGFCPSRLGFNELGKLGTIPLKEQAQ